MTILSARKLTLIILMMFHAAVSANNTGMSYFQGETLIHDLEKTLDLLHAWSEDNTNKANKLEKYFHKDNDRTENNIKYTSKEAWEDVKDLNQNTLMLLESSYEFAKKTASASEYGESSMKTSAWERCIKTSHCNFKLLNEMIDEESLKLFSFTKDNASKTQALLIDNIDRLNEFSAQSFEAVGLNDSVDTLARINSASANALNSLAGQISNLSKLQAHQLQSAKYKEQLAQKATDKYIASQKKVKSQHLSTRLSDYSRLYD